MIKMETFSDHDGVQRNGLACYYYANGKLDSVGHYKNGKKEGSFVKYRFTTNDSLEQEKFYEYANDSLVSTPANHQDPADSKTSNGDIAPAYPGGLTQWQQFLGKNLHYPDRATGNKVQGEVKILFAVDEQGTVVEPLISKSVEYSLDRESLRLIRLSGKWEPGVKDGKIAKTYKIEPIRFVLPTE
jgi:protein TonB